MDKFNALADNVMIAKAVADMLKTTLGPKGMDKMLIDAVGDIVVTNDGATVLKEVELKHPAAKMIAETAKALEEEVGDGTTTAVVITGELLKNALKLKNKGLHPTVIIKGYELASDYALKVLEEEAVKINISEEKELKKIIQTALTGKNVEKVKGLLAGIIINAFRKTGNPDNIKIEKKTGQSLSNSRLINGILIDKEPVFSEMSKKIDNARIILTDAPIEVKTLETESEIEIKIPEQLKSFKDKEQEILKLMIKEIIKVKVNMVICQKGIDEEAQQLLANNGITAIRRVRKTDMELLSKALGVNITTNLKDLKKSDVSNASMITKRVGDEEMTIIYNCTNPRAVTILLRGAQEQLLDEVKRAVDDALGNLRTVMKDDKVLPGAGACELMQRKKLLEYADKISGREQLAVKAFAEALEVIPKALITNSGGEVLDLMPKLIKLHESGNYWGAGDKPVNALNQGIIEPLELKKQVIKTAYEASKMILRIDDMILKQRKK